MRLVFLVTSYRNPSQVVRLVRLLSSVPGSFVLVHHDKNAGPTSLGELRAALCSLENVKLMEPSSFGYATFDHVRISLGAARWALDEFGSLDHFVILTGQCYPIKSLPDIEQWFKDRADRSVMRLAKLPHPHWPDGGYNRVNIWILRARRPRLPRSISWAIPKRDQWIAIPKPSLIRYRLGGPIAVRTPRSVGALYGGVGYVALAGHHLEYIVRHSAPYERFFRRSYIPDELFFQTMIGNSEFRHEISDEELHHQEFRGMHPRVMTCDDLPTLERSPAIFTRKVDCLVDPELLDRIDTEILRIDSGG